MATTYPQHSDSGFAQSPGYVPRPVQYPYQPIPSPTRQNNQQQGFRPGATQQQPAQSTPNVAALYGQGPYRGSQVGPNYSTADIYHGPQSQGLAGGQQPLQGLGQQQPAYKPLSGGSSPMTGRQPWEPNPMAPQTHGPQTMTGYAPVAQPQTETQRVFGQNVSPTFANGEQRPVPGRYRFSVDASGGLVAVMPDGQPLRVGPDGMIAGRPWYEFANFATLPSDLQRRAMAEGYGRQQQSGSIQTSIQPQQMYPQGFMQQAGNVAAAGQVPAYNDLAAKRQLPGVSIQSPMTQTGMGYDLGSALAGAALARPQVTQQFGFANAGQNLAQQQARDQEALAWGGLANQQQAANQQSQLTQQGGLLNLLQGLLRGY